MVRQSSHQSTWFCFPCAQNNIGFCSRHHGMTQCCRHHDDSGAKGLRAGAANTVTSLRLCGEYNICLLFTNHEAALENLPQAIVRRWVVLLCAITFTSLDMSKCTYNQVIYTSGSAGGSKKEKKALWERCCEVGGRGESVICYIQFMNAHSQGAVWLGRKPPSLGW